KIDEFIGVLAAVTGFNCPGGKLTSQERKEIVAQHNDYRSQLVNRKLRNADDKLMPKGKNMMEMVKIF
ncbi:unnamed protein product, partial [Onchocerca ochengi]|uniref:SCP domain-containing protein n=1 Tax=Onchocerca ochengi TaxID=42157 RepID=A0A182EZY1_ONCOC